MKGPYRLPEAAYRWKNYGKERLYLLRIEAGAKHDLGWIDVKGDGLKADAAETRPLLVYCRNRILAWPAPGR